MVTSDHNSLMENITNYELNKQSKAPSFEQQSGWLFFMLRIVGFRYCSVPIPRRQWRLGYHSLCNCKPLFAFSFQFHSFKTLKYSCERRFSDEVIQQVVFQIADLNLCQTWKQVLSLRKSAESAIISPREISLQIIPSYTWLLIQNTMQKRK